MSQYAELKAQIAKLQAQADEARRSEVANVIAEIEESAVAREIPRPENRQHVERPRQAAEVDRRQESRSLSDCAVM